MEPEFEPAVPLYSGLLLRLRSNLKTKPTVPKGRTKQILNSRYVFRARTICSNKANGLHACPCMDSSNYKLCYAKLVDREQ